MEFKLPGGLSERLKEAGKRVQAEIDKIGEEEYYRRLEERRRREEEEWQKEDFEREAALMLGERFKGCTFGSLEVSCDPGKGYDNRKAKEAAVRFAAEFPGSPKTEGLWGDKKTGRGLILSGPNGIGKNHLAAAIANELRKRYVRTYFGSITKIKTKICDAFGGGVGAAVEELLGYGLIVINDLGAERESAAQDWAQEFLFDFVDRIYESKKPLVITTNLDADGLYRRYGARIVSRILGMCDVVKYNDRDHRVAPGPQ
jgi:DNA replication protein DnaC